MRRHEGGGGASEHHPIGVGHLSTKLLSTFIHTAMKPFMIILNSNANYHSQSMKTTTTTILNAKLQTIILNQAELLCLLTPNTMTWDLGLFSGG